MAVGQPADGLVWLDSRDPDGLSGVLAASPGIRWVQLPFAGVEAYASRGIFGDGRTWTCAKGSYAEPVAEHALMLALAGLRQLPERVRATAWGKPAGLSLYDQPVTILGGGGITSALLGLLAPFRVRATVVRRRPEPVPGALRVVATEHLHDALPGALVVFVALALTPETTGIIVGPELALMDSRAWLVNVARGRHVATDALVDALMRHEIAGAALDVTDPEPLPDGHPLWALDDLHRDAAHRRHPGDDRAAAGRADRRQRGPPGRRRALGGADRRRGRLLSQAGRFVGWDRRRGT